MDVGNGAKYVRQNRPKTVAVIATLCVGVYRIWFAARFDTRAKREKTAPKLTLMAQSRVNKCGRQFFQIGIANPA